jgi:hypothetical protein
VYEIGQLAQEEDSNASALAQVVAVPPLEFTSQLVIGQPVHPGERGGAGGGQLLDPVEHSARWGAGRRAPLVLLLPPQPP